MNADRRKPSRGLPLRLLHAETDPSASAVLAALVDELEAAFTPEERAAFANLPVHQDPVFGVLAKYLGPGATLDIGQVARVLGYSVGDTSDIEGDALAKCDTGGIAPVVRADVEAFFGVSRSASRETLAPRPRRRRPTPPHPSTRARRVDTNGHREKKFPCTKPR